jgi:8-oxo-dGTP pyrophosphatase MutT (NUDIX family)
MHTIVVCNVIHRIRTDKDGGITEYLIGMHKDSHKENQYCFPGGKVEPDEKTENAFWRELEEETGLINPKDNKVFRKTWIEIEFSGKLYLLLFMSRPWCPEMGEPVLKEPEKHYFWKWMTRDEIMDSAPSESTIKYFNFK